VWNKTKHERPSSAAAAAPALKEPPLSAAAEASVRQLIANGKDKVAVETAKEIHKAQGTAASEALLVDAYAARIQALFDRNLGLEAKALLELVRERYPSARQRLNGCGASAKVQAGRLEDLVRPLNDPELSAERRAAIESTIAREPDLGALAECAALPPEHPLRQAASGLQRALLTVTEGPVGEEAVELAEVSHRSPLAPWKLLVRAIACFYRGEDEACRRYLETIKPESAPARLVPAMQAMLGGKPAGLTAAAAALVSSITSDPGVLRKALEGLDKAFDSDKHGAILNAIRDAVKACRETAPDQMERLKQHIAVRCSLADLNVDRVQAALGGNSRHDAYFWRLFARGMEQLGEPQNIVQACRMWEEFRQQAVREGWFTANGPEAATLYLHMAGVLQTLPHDLLGELQKMALRQSSKTAEEPYYLYPEKLYARACALDPHTESFSQWMEWAKRGRKGTAEDVAEAWHKARPMDIEPILFLMEEKEKRNAFHTSLQYLAKAERIDGVNPAVRRARLRLLASSALRHIQQKKPHLAEERLAQMAALPQAQQGDRPAYLAALRYMVSRVRYADDEAAAHRREVERVLGSKEAAALVIFGVANAAKQAALDAPPPVSQLGKSERAALPEAVIRVCELAKDMRLIQPIPADWMAETEKQFSRSSQSLQSGQLQTLAMACLSLRQLGLAYAASAAGLERGGTDEVRFLLLRARSLPEHLQERRAMCALAAAQLARHARQMDIVEAAVGLVSDTPFRELSFTPEQAATVLKKEKAERAFPTPSRPGPDYREFLGRPCPCPNCRRARGEAVAPFEDFEFDEGEDDFDEDEDFDESDMDAAFAGMPLPPDMPPEIAKMMFAEAAKALDRGESLDSLLNRLFGPGTLPAGKRKKGRRR
jgi:hypothetical protein